MRSKENFGEQIIVEQIMNDKAEFDVMMSQVVIDNFKEFCFCFFHLLGVETEVVKNNKRVISELCKTVLCDCEITAQEFNVLLLKFAEIRLFLGLYINWDV